MHRPWILWGGVGLLALLLAFWLFAPGEDKKAPRGEGAQQQQSEAQSAGGRRGRRGAGVMPVSFAQAQRGDIAVRRSALGTVTPLATVTVRTKIAGQLTKITFQEGQMVNEGDLLAEVDPRPYEHALQQAQGQLARDQALLKDAQINLGRYQKLMKEDSIARQQLDTQRALVRQYEGVVVSDQAQVDNAKLNLEYCSVRAPISGRAGLRQVDQGNYVNNGDASGIVVITQINPISVVFSVPEDDLSAIMAKMAQGEKLEATAFDRTNSVQLGTGVLSAVDSQIDPTTGTVKLRGEFGNEEQKLFANQFVNISLLVDTLRDVIIVPAAAVQRGSQGSYVYVINADNTVSLKLVKTGVAEGERLQITEGEINPGDKLVMDGADRLKDGAKITLPDANAPEGRRRERGSDAKEPSPANQGSPNAPVPVKESELPAKPPEAAATSNSQGTPDNGAPAAAFGATPPAGETQRPAASPPASQ